MILIRIQSLCPPWVCEPQSCECDSGRHVTWWYRGAGEEKWHRGTWREKGWEIQTDPMIMQVVSDGARRKRPAHVQVCVCVCLRVYIFPCLNLSLLHFMMQGANGPSTTQWSSRAWLSCWRAARHCGPANNPARVPLCGHLCLAARMAACMLRLLLLLCGFVCAGGILSFFLLFPPRRRLHSQSVSMINVRVHTCKRKNPLGQQ